MCMLKDCLLHSLPWSSSKFCKGLMHLGMCLLEDLRYYNTAAYLSIISFSIWNSTFSIWNDINVLNSDIELLTTEKVFVNSFVWFNQALSEKLLQFCYRYLSISITYLIFLIFTFFFFMVSFLKTFVLWRDYTNQNHGDFIDPMPDLLIGRHTKEKVSIAWVIRIFRDDQIYNALIFYFLLTLQ